ncbi:MAG TPA: DUF1223 domain-containing protein [Phenylobacterium sp.]|uniref:DUF1223 domain-containing protein n=1 Tax=Phenylobacterium sp. TaxID=1871053 RepID=UPI002CEA7BD1|nr:DUF1223 domain-containing protein [Phenylobacterium sp.]HSV01688.1 DUF1223 domain-containing protein [Phenylobacterium sp.]
MRNAALLSLILAALPCAAVAKMPVVVELYTAQGCGSCGAADAYLAKLAEQPGVLVLTFPVDYWDYLGWSDTFAKPEFADRQKAYVAKLSLREPYTPQVVVDGQLQATGLKTEHIESLVKEAAHARHNPPDIKFIAGGRRVDVGSGHAPAGGADVWLIRYDPREQDVAVKSGDNRGQTIVQKNVVREMARLGAWKGRPRAYKLPAPGEDGLKTVIVVQQAHGGRILGLAEQKS